MSPRPPPKPAATPGFSRLRENLWPPGDRTCVISGGRDGSAIDSHGDISHLALPVGPVQQWDFAAATSTELWRRRLEPNTWGDTGGCQQGASLPHLVLRVRCHARLTIDFLEADVFCASRLLDEAGQQV